MMFNDDSLVGRPRVDTPPPPPPPPEGGHGAKRNLSSVDTDPRPPRPVRPHLTPEQSAEQARLRLTALVRTAMSPKAGAPRRDLKVALTSVNPSPGDRPRTGSRRRRGRDVGDGSSTKYRRA